MLEPIISIGLMAFLILYIAFTLEEKHQVLKALALFFGIFLIFILAKANLDAAAGCSMQPGASAGDYIEVCQNNEHTIATAQTAYKVVIGFLALTFLYLIGFLIKLAKDYLEGAREA